VHQPHLSNTIPHCGMSRRDLKKMSSQYPECPLYNHVNCKERDNKKVCALVRKDRGLSPEPQETKEETSCKCLIAREGEI